jgi:hypothetical protein
MDMRTKLRSKSSLLVLTIAVLLAVPAVAAIADDFNADADAIAVQVPGSGSSNTFSANQQPGTTQSYPFSATIRETGNEADNVFVASGDHVTVNNTFGGDWLNPGGPGNPPPSFPPSFVLSGYDQNFTGVISITVPCNAAANTSKAMTVTLDASASNGKSLNGDPQTVSYNITASGSPAASCTPADTTTPKVSSINRANANPTNASSVGWDVTFSESVTGVDAGDFQLANTGLTGPGSISVTGSGTTYSVTANTGTGSGTLGLNLNDNDSIKDGANNTLAGTSSADGSFTGEVYTIDKTKPVIIGSAKTQPGGADYTAGEWTNKDVEVSFSCTDSGGSDINTNTVAGATKTGSGENQSVTNTGSCTDNAGNTADSATFENIDIDKVAPNVTATPSRNADHNGWYNAPFTVSFSGTDTGGSDIDSCDANVSYNGPDGTGKSVSGSCTDKAGNSAQATYTFKYDATDPTATADADRSADHNGWYNAPLTVSFSGTDATSDPVSCDADVNYNGPDGTGKSISGSCTDDAGNSAQATYTFKYDATDPTATATPSRAADHNGWYNHAVTVSFSGNDATSGPVSCDADVNYNGPDGTGKSVSGSCTDDAGNSAQATYNFKYDATKPNTTATPSRGPDHNGWYNHAVTFGFDGQDATSDIESCSAARVYDGPDGTNLTVDGTCTDGAGNTSDPGVSSSFDYDDTAPNNVAGALNRSADHNGWYNHAVGYQFTGDDATSDIDSCTSGTYSGPDSGSASVNGSCTDNAGNSTNGTSSAFKYDATGPTNVSGAPVRPADHNGWYTSPVNIDFSGEDATSNIDSCSTVPYNGPDGNNITVNGSCTDNAGNSTNGTSSAFKYDATAPSVNATPDRSADSNGWYNHAVTVSFSGNDATSDIASCDPAVNYSGPDSGTASVNGTCTDNAGNQSASGTFNFKYDDTAPAITSVGATTTPNVAGWYKNAIDNTFKAADGVSGFSGHSDPYNFTQSSGTQQGNAVTIASGQVTDVAGNSAASINSAAFKIDLSDPTNVTFVGGPAANGSYDFGSVPAQPTCTAQDVPSGVKSCVVTGYSTLVGTHTMTATATDNADRTATAMRIYTVKPWDFSGFYQPVDMLDSMGNPVVNTVKAGSTVPFKFELFKGTDPTTRTELTDTANVVQPLTAKSINCTTLAGDSEDPIELTATGGTLLRYDTTGGQFIYNWQTPKKVGTCYSVTISSNDGSSKTAYFKLK